MTIEIAVIKPGRGRTIRDVETQLRGRLESEGHVLPWDNAVPPGSKKGDPGRLGRGGQGTPFVRKSGEAFAWTRDGQRISIPEKVAELRQQRMTDQQVYDWFTTNTTLTRENAEKLISSRFATQIKAAEAARTPDEGQ